MKHRWGLLIALPLAACVEAQDRQMAQCRADATKTLSSEQLLSGQHAGPIRRCMAERGYDFDDTIAECRAATEGFLSERAACYAPSKLIDRIVHRLELQIRRLSPI